MRVGVGLAFRLPSVAAGVAGVFFVELADGTGGMGGGSLNTRDSGAMLARLGAGNVVCGSGGSDAAGDLTGTVVGCGNGGDNAGCGVCDDDDDDGDVVVVCVTETETETGAGGGGGGRGAGDSTLVLLNSTNSDGLPSTTRNVA